MNRRRTVLFIETPLLDSDEDHFVLISISPHSHFPLYSHSA